MDDKLSLMHGDVTWPVVNFGGPIHISGMADARTVKFYEQGDYIKSCKKGWQITPKMGVVWLTWPIFASAAVELEKLCHSTPFIKINNVVDDRPPFLVPWTVDAIQGLSSISLICHCICCKLGCIIYRQLCANNRHFSVCVAICCWPTLVAW